MRLLGFKHSLSLQSYKFSMTFRGEWTEEPERKEPPSKRYRTIWHAFCSDMMTGKKIKGHPVLYPAA